MSLVSDLHKAIEEFNCKNYGRVTANVIIMHPHTEYELNKEIWFKNPFAIRKDTYTQSITYMGIRTIRSYDVEQNKFEVY